jgi:hypothetical protein
MIEEDTRKPVICIDEQGKLNYKIKKRKYARTCLAPFTGEEFSVISL